MVAMIHGLGTLSAYGNVQKLHNAKIALFYTPLPPVTACNTSQHPTSSYLTLLIPPPPVSHTNLRVLFLQFKNLLSFGTIKKLYSSGSVINIGCFNFGAS